MNVTISDLDIVAICPECNTIKDKFADEHTRDLWFLHHTHDAGGAG